MRLVVALRIALARLAARRGRTLLAAVGIFAAAAMTGTAVTVGFSLETGFDRSAEAADLPDVIARFEDRDPAEVDERVRALPNLEARAYRTEETNVPLRDARGHTTDDGVLQVVRRGRRGYGIVAGRDLNERPFEIVIERGLATSWDLAPGDHIRIFDSPALEVVGIAVSPDNVAFPLAKSPRVYTSYEGLVKRFGRRFIPDVNMVLLWARDDSRLDLLLSQARATSYGIDDLSFVTRSGVRILLDRAAGIVVALLVAFSLVALGAAGIMLGASASSEVQRRLPSIGVERALGFSRRSVAGRAALEGILVALPAGALGLTAGALLSSAPTAELLESLNELAPGGALITPLIVCLAAIVAIVAAAAAWPAWRAASRPPAEVMRGGDLSGAGGGVRLGGGGLLGFGARLAVARRARLLATVVVVGGSVAVVLLMLALANVLDGLANDPGSVGKRYQLTANLPPEAVDDVRAIPGVAAAASRYSAEGTDSFDLGETLQVVAYPGDHTTFEAPPLAEGRRVEADDEVEIGLGLAQALNLDVGGTLAIQLEDGGEARFRVVGIVRAIDNDGRQAWVRPPRLLAAAPGASQQIAVRLRDESDRAAVSSALRELGSAPGGVRAATTRSAQFIDVLANLLRLIALVDGLICLYALIQALALTARERRQTVALLRACGAGTRSVMLVLAGAAAAVALPAALVGVALERWLLGPAVGDLAADYVVLPLGAGTTEVLVVAAGLVALALLAALLVARRSVREPIVGGLREA